MFAKRVTHLLASVFVLAACLPGALFAAGPTITLKALSKTCYEPGTTIVLDGTYPSQAFSDFSIFYTVDPTANAPTLGGRIAYPVLKLPFEYVLPSDFPQADSVRFWVAGNDGQKRVTMASTDFLSTSGRCLHPLQIFGAQPERISQRQAYITWHTSDLATAHVEYGTSITFGASTADMVGNAHGQKAILNELTPATLYYFHVVAHDQNGNTQSSLLNTFTTLPLLSTSTAPTDSMPILLSDVYVNDLSATKKEITWQTDTPADSEVEYGLTTRFGTSIRDDLMTTFHSATLDHLKPNRVYAYRVMSTHGSEKTVSQRLRFAAIAPSTKVQSDAQAPDVTSLPVTPLHIVSITADSAEIAWETTELATAKVRYGKTMDLRAVSESNTPASNHHFVLVGLQPHTQYFFRLESSDADGALSFGEPRGFITLDEAGYGGGMAPFDFGAVRRGSDLVLRWQNPHAQDFSFVVLLKKMDAQPTDARDGTVLYNGSGETFTVPDEIGAKYALYAVDHDGAPSSMTLLDSDDAKGPQWNFPRTERRQGSSGDDIKELQRFLQDTGFFPLSTEPTGYFGTTTRSALRDYQKAAGLPQSGIFDASILTLLQKMGLAD